MEKALMILTVTVLKKIQKKTQLQENHWNKRKHTNFSIFGVLY